MFTGIVQDQCEVTKIEDIDGIRQLTVELGTTADGLQRGASVANNGVCLTATEIGAGSVRFDIIEETLSLTNLGAVEVGDKVNIERSLSFGDEVGGHIVSGHVSLTVSVHEIEAVGANRTMWFQASPVAMPYLLHKGWVALDGASLTISRVDRENHRFAVSLIPETLEATTLGRATIGSRVNIEFDAQTQTIVQTVRDLLSDETLRNEILGAS